MDAVNNRKGINWVEWTGLPFNVSNILLNIRKCPFISSTSFALCFFPRSYLNYKPVNAAYKHTHPICHFFLSIINLSKRKPRNSLLAPIIIVPFSSLIHNTLLISITSPESSANINSFAKGFAFYVVAQQVRLCYKEYI